MVKMPSGDGFVEFVRSLEPRVWIGIVVGLTVTWVLGLVRWTWGRIKRLGPWGKRRVLRLFPCWAEKRFKRLRRNLGGLREQAVMGKVMEVHRTAVAADLAFLDIWPQGIRGERSGDMVGAEADYLERCTGSRFGLGIAREKFPKDGTQGWRCRTDSQGEFMGDEYQRDVLGRYYDELQGRKDGR